jgi:hypothetical protein
LFSFIDQDATSVASVDRCIPSPWPSAGIENRWAIVRLHGHVWIRPPVAVRPFPSRQ